MKTSIFLLFAGTSTVILMQAATGYEFADVASKRGEIVPSFTAKKLTGETLYYVPAAPPKPAPKPAPKPELKTAPKPTPAPKAEPKIVAPPKPPVAAPTPVPAPKVMAKPAPEKPAKKGGLFGLFAKSEEDKKAPEPKPEAKKSPAKPIVEAKPDPKPEPKPVKEMAKAELKPEPKIIAEPKPPVPAPAPKVAVKPTPEKPAKKGGLFGLFAKSDEPKKGPEPKSMKELAKAEPKPAPVPAPAPPPPPLKKPEPKPEVAKEDAKPEGKSGLRRFFGLGKDKNEQPKAELKPKEIAKVENKPSKPEAKLPPPPKEMKPIVSQTAEVVTKKKTPPPLIAAPEPKKPGFFARLLGKKSDKISEESAVDADDRPQKPADWESKYIVSDDNVKFFAYGPSQAIDSDERLSKGTVVSLKKGGKAWAEISLESGRVVTVGADQIRPAKLNDFAPPPVAIAATRVPSSDVYYEPAPPPNLPDASNAGTIDFPELLLPPLPPQ